MQKIIMIDQDGVVCNKKYQITKNINKLINDIIKQKIILIPNSDTPIKRLRDNFQIMLNFIAPIIIGEKGSVVYINEQDFFLKNIIGIQNYINKLVYTLKTIGAEVIVGDSATWIRNKKKFKPNSKIIIIDKLRQQTISFFIKQTNQEGFPYANINWSKMVFRAIAQIQLPNGLDKLNYNSIYGIAIANVSGITKTDGYCFLRNYYSDAIFFMIGDGIIDIINDQSVVHCSVGNAKDDFKNISKFVSKKTYTEGLEECLQWIINQ